ncbi:hypothetical protein HJG60_007639 [Phyllostomus discolor]|uniref:Ig-like domain-containing protein n=1 Tax=Phyllostomus discolor TaxID=89673 RepID=A0A833YJ11_9CHIR|nr:hypothetical protein HJG60_007639 [Phyllostomus discolor]
MAGSTRTATLTVLLYLGLCRGPWDQVQAGVPPKPSIWADPGPMIRKGSPVTIWCQGSLQADGYLLYKDRGSQPLDTSIPQTSSNKTGFLIQSMSSQYTGLYQCAYSTGDMLSERSEPLLLVMTGVYREPSLSAQPGPLVLPGDSLTLQCHSEPGFDRFALTKDQQPTRPQYLQGQRSPNFSLGPVNLAHRGRYRCYSGHNLSYVWSAPSAPLDILIAGIYKKPSLSAQPGPSVPWGVNVTLQCGSEVRADTFHLHREGSLDPPQQLHLQDTAAPSQANFTISPVTWGHNGTYRCYSSHSSSLFQLSQPSDPLELLVSGGPEDQPTMKSGPQLGLQWSLSILIGVSVALVLLLSLLFFLRHWSQNKGRTSTPAQLLTSRKRTCMLL